MAAKKQSGQDGLLSVYAAGIAADMAEQGYSPHTIQHQLCLFATVGRWLAREGLALVDLTPGALQRFEKYRRQHGGSSRKRSLVPMLRYLRRIGVVPEMSKPVPDGPFGKLLERYREHLVLERGWQERPWSNMNGRLDCFSPSGRRLGDASGWRAWTEPL